MNIWLYTCSQQITEIQMNEKYKSIEEVTVSTTGGGPATLDSIAATFAFGITFGTALTTAWVTAKANAFALRPAGTPNTELTCEATFVATLSR